MSTARLTNAFAIIQGIAGNLQIILPKFEKLAKVA
jgi:hypothetical protein